jgi:DNA-binding CsgD family transcriptional regulator
MTRLLYLPDDATIIQLEVEITPRQLSAAVNAGLKPVPQLTGSAHKLSASLVGNTVIVFPQHMHNHPGKSGLRESLTKRQSQVLDLAMSGYSCAQIAGIMGISRRTVAYHLKGIKSLIQPGVISGALKGSSK